jgi:hypothetical protein
MEIDHQSPAPVAVRGVQPEPKAMRILAMSVKTPRIFPIAGRTVERKKPSSGAPSCLTLD